MKKVVRDGKVAILYTGDYGAGWFTWNQEYPECVFDPDIVEAVEKGDREKAAKIASEKYENFYTGGAQSLMIRWIKQGTCFRINEYHGYESIATASHLSFKA